MNEIFSKHLIHPRTVTELQPDLRGNFQSVTPCEKWGQLHRIKLNAETPTDTQYKLLTAVADIESY